MKTAHRNASRAKRQLRESAEGAPDADESETETGTETDAEYDTTGEEE